MTLNFFSYVLYLLNEIRKGTVLSVLDLYFTEWLPSTDNV